MAPRMAPVVVLVVALTVGAMAPGSPVSPRTPKLDGAPDDVSPEKGRGAPRGPLVIGEEGHGGGGELLSSSGKIDGGEEKEGVGGEGEERVELELEDEDRKAEQRLIEGIDRYNARFSSPPRCVVRLPRGARKLPPPLTPRRSRSAPRRLDPRRFSCPATPGRIPRPLPPRRDETEKGGGGGGEGTRKGEGVGASPLRGGAPYGGRARTARHSAASASSSSSSSSASYSSSSPADAFLGRG